MDAIGTWLVEWMMGTKVAIPLLSVVLEFVREPCLPIGEELQFTVLKCTNVRLEI
jgi:hypothetical protein